MLAMAEARTLEEGVRAMNRTAAPPQNVLLADAGGRIAWTYLGKLPVRRGFDGATARSWADGPARGEALSAPDPSLLEPLALPGRHSTAVSAPCHASLCIISRFA